MKLVVKTLVWLMVLLWLWAPTMARGHQAVSLTPLVLNWENLPAKDFEGRFGDNPLIPRTDDAILTLARQLFPSLAEKELMAAGPEQPHRCGRPRLGLLFAALKNPSISDYTRREVSFIIAGGIPVFTKTYTKGHFRFFYTDNDVDHKHNVTLSQIESTAHFLNYYWDLYGGPRFKTPKHYVSDDKQMIDVLVFYLDEETHGETCDIWNCIILNSKLAVADDCRQRTASAHQLFHRVQYSYGLVDGAANTDWLAEGSAGWAQKWTNQTIWDYMDLMNDGLHGGPLLSRYEDATLFFAYEASRFDEDWSAVRDIWTAFGLNGHMALEAVDVVVWKRFKKTFNQFLRSWLKANYLKDYLPLSTYTKYPENKEVHTTCGRTHGPLNRIVPSYSGIARNRISSGSGFAYAYGAHYWEFNIAEDVDTVSINFQDYGTSSSYHFYGILKGNTRYRLIKDITPTPNSSFGIGLDTHRRYSKIAMVVCGNDDGALFQFWGTGN